MISKEQVADLRKGDVVELRDEEGWPGAVVRGPLYEEEGDLCLGPLLVTRNGAPRGPRTRTLTVVSRAPRPLYVNHPRTEPRAGDVARAADEDYSSITYTFGRSRWFGTRTAMPIPSDSAPGAFRLLVDGETGQVVPS